MQLKRLVLLVLTLAQTNARLLVLQRLRGGATLALPDELQLSSSATALTTEQAAGLDMLSEVGEADFDAAVSVLVKVLDNLIAQPDEARYRKLRTSNGKIRTLLATDGVRPLLVGSGFVEEAGALNAERADVATVQAGLEGLQRLKASRAAAAQAAAPILRVRPPGGATSTFRPMWQAPLFRLDSSGPQISRRDVEGVDGAFVLLGLGLGWR